MNELFAWAEVGKGVLMCVIASPICLLRDGEVCMEQSTVRELGGELLFFYCF